MFVDRNLKKGFYLQYHGIKLCERHISLYKLLVSGLGTKIEMYLRESMVFVCVKTRDRKCESRRTKGVTLSRETQAEKGLEQSSWPVHLGQVCMELR